MTWNWCAATWKSSPPVPDTSPGRDGLVGLLVGFARELRAAGVAAGSGEVQAYCAAAAALAPSDLLDLYWAGRTTLVTRREQISIYDEVFRRYFPGAEDPVRPLPAIKAGRQAGTEAALRVPETEPGPDRPREEAMLGWQASDVDVLKHKAFAACTPEELAALR